MLLDKLKEMLKRHEGLMLTPYLCPTGHRTLGYGHNIESCPLAPEMALRLASTGSITEKDADDLLDEDITRSLTHCRALWDHWDDFSENRQAALCDFMFNVGPGTAQEFVATNAAIDLGLWKFAASNLLDSKYARQVPNRAKEIAEMLEKG